MTTTTFSPAAVEHGPLGELILHEIRRCMSLRGGVEHDGEHWIYKSARELAERCGAHRNTVARRLRQLVALGVLVREQLGVAVGHVTNRCWYYRWGDNAPAWLKRPLGNATHQNGAVHCTTVVQSNKTSTPNKIHSRPAHPQIQRPTAGTEGVMTLARTLAAGGAEAPLERDADGFLIAPGPKAQALQDQHPDATEEELIEEACRQIEESVAKEEAKKHRLNPLHGALGGRRKQAKGFA